MKIKLHKEAENPIELNKQQSKSFGILRALGFGIHKVDQDNAVVYQDQYKPIRQISRDEIVSFLEKHCTVRGKNLKIEIVDELPRLAPGIQLDEIYNPI